VWTCGVFVFISYNKRTYKGYKINFNLKKVLLNISVIRRKEVVYFPGKFLKVGLMFASNG
jgi:hypothetical protein